MAKQTAGEMLPHADGGPPSSARPFLRRMPFYGFLGALLTILAWMSSWGRVGPWPFTFFPLWLGFILLLDGLNVARTGSSPIRRGVVRFVLLFVYSVPFWWTFEALNTLVQNWHYHLDRQYTQLAFVAISSISFSTVLPAVVEMAELLVSISALRPRLTPPDIGPRLGYGWALGVVALGGFMVWLASAFPTYAFPLVWLCVGFLLDPINNLARRKSAVGHLLTGDWRFFVVLPLAALCCGFFWELWNSHALPNWSYTVPFVDIAPHLFAMPAPGYLGYLPFGIELFAYYQFVLLITFQRRDVLTF